MRLPVVLVTGTDPDTMAATTIGIQWDLPFAVAVHHRIDVRRQVLTRVVSDVTGLLETEEIDLDHACVPCAIREDIMATLQRVAADGRWRSVLCQLPAGAAPTQVCHVLGGANPAGRRLRVSAVIAAVDGRHAVHDLLGDDLLGDRGVATSQDDSRGLGEVLALLVEGADVVVLGERPPPEAHALVTTLARPGASVVAGATALVGEVIAAGDVHRHDLSRAWTAVDRRVPLPAVRPGAWRLDLRSDRPFHPGRLVRGISELGGGRHRSRGCFWLPTRPGDVQVWDGAGGQLSIGREGPRGREPELTRVVLVGTGERPDHLRHTFERLLVSEDELVTRGPCWEATDDGLEAWLGPIHRAASA